MSDDLNNVVLACDELTKVYDEGPEKLVVLNGINVKVRRGERVAIVGSSGSGKTTLLNMLAGLDNVSSGSVAISGQDMASMSDVERGELRNRHLGFVYQFHHLLPEFTALENTAMPLMLRKGCSVSEARNRAKELLEIVGLGKRLTHKPSELSGGERQRVAIARALVAKPSLVLMDEPTGNLDIHTAERIQKLMLELAEKVDTAFVVVTHDPELAGKMDRVLKLVDGQLLEE
ncbi:lipoprotein-releasing ABC transporter ATP-binding protein LolD [Sansalvadorimonas verongulae]|uniref:lipoprotein-releasing ABC transporter ATP-binding protein LolD n=1 Tax=Sansalvadorimonas verongulae TaxID=2172824 RepID=UPI0012BD7E5D|nr:lipoprotein-releasing ABC transporter ATP-binding protein LolD [Sansalvadorimonas verongulae]MTI14685.1 lipoprotein-releasing ABC transporter ATP-binding protein LolD [Sansalvadorimonas verongulae]